MDVWVSAGWKFALAATLLVSILLSAFARAPSRSLSPSDLHRLVLCAVFLYAVGTIAWLAHHRALSILLYAAGIATAALAGWLSRGTDHGEPPDGFEANDDPPAPDPDGLRFDWERFERQLRDYSEGRRPRAGASR